MSGSWAERYGIDLKKMADDAFAAGFNPLTLMRNGAWQAYVIQPLGVNGQGYGSEYEGQYGGGELTDNPFGHGGGGGNEGGYGYYEDEGPDGVWTDGGKFRPTRAALEGYAQSMADVVRAAGGTPIQRPAVNGGTGPGSPRVRTQTAAEAVASASSKTKEGFQPTQVWDKSKQPNIVQGDTVHYIAPGVSFVEQGGGTRANVWEDIYGEDSPLVWLLQAPKFLDDVGYNVRRLGWHLGIPTIDTVTDAVKSRMAEAHKPLPTSKDQYGRTIFGEPGITIGGSGASISMPSQYRPTPSFAAASERSAAASTRASVAKPQPAQTAKEQAKAQKAKAESKSPGKNK